MEFVELGSEGVESGLRGRFALGVSMKCYRDFPRYELLEPNNATFKSKRRG